MRSEVLKVIRLISWSACDELTLVRVATFSCRMSSIFRLVVALQSLLFCINACCMSRMPVTRVLCILEISSCIRLRISCSFRLIISQNWRRKQLESIRVVDVSIKWGMCSENQLGFTEFGREIKSIQVLLWREAWVMVSPGSVVLFRNRKFKRLNLEENANSSSLSLLMESGTNSRI